MRYSLLLFRSAGKKKCEIVLEKKAKRDGGVAHVYSLEVEGSVTICALHLRTCCSVRISSLPVPRNLNSNAMALSDST